MTTLSNEIILRLAKEAGCTTSNKGHYGIALNGVMCTTEITKIIKLVMAEEREECAKICETINVNFSEHPEMAITCAEAIRNRGKKL